MQACTLFLVMIVINITLVKTLRNLDKSIYEHKRSIKLNDHRNTLFYHTIDFKHTFSLGHIIKLIHYRNSCCLYESAIISHFCHHFKPSSNDLAFFIFHLASRILFYGRIPVGLITDKSFKTFYFFPTSYF